MIIYLSQKKGKKGKRLNNRLLLLFALFISGLDVDQGFDDFSV